MTDRRLSPGLARLSRHYCQLTNKHIEHLTRSILETLHEIMTRAGTVEEAIDCLDWFNKNDEAPKARDHMNLRFILACFDSFEQYSKKNTVKMGKADLDRLTHEYRLMQGK